MGGFTVSRRSANPSVSLFPFLAVLVCAMGALILLLLVNTRRIRHHLELEALAERQQTSAPTAETDPERERQALLRAQLNAQREQEIADRIAAHDQALAQHQADRDAKLAHWQSQLVRMNERNAELSSRLSQARQIVQSNASAAAQLDEESQKLAALLGSATDHHQVVLQTETQLRNELKLLTDERESMKQKVASAQNQHAAHQKAVFEVVAYDGNSRTERRPILIECRADRLIFASEGISISAATLDEFGPDRNPLLAGTEALLTYWTLVDAQTERDKPGPYVLLIVRPGGTTGFYVARRYLEALNREFGYELVSADAEIAWPAADPQAVEVCRTAVDRALQEQRAAGNSNGSRNSDGRGVPAGRRSPFREDRVVGSDGEFVLAEVERLKRGGGTGDSIDMLGSEWQRRGTGSNEPANGRSGQSNNRPEAEPGDAGTPSQEAASQEFGVAGATGGKRAQPFPSASGEPNRTVKQAQPASGANQAADVANGDAGNRSAAVRAQQGSGADAPSRMAGDRRAQSQGTPGSQGARQQGDALPPSPFQQAAELTNDGGQNRQWGQSRGGGAIGIERTIDLHLHLDRIRIVDGQTLAIPPDIDRPDFQENVASLIQQHANTWGEAPSKFVWRPALHVFIHPGGNQHYPRIKQLAEHWGLSCKPEYVLESR
jgi:hypothetical protein